MGQFRHHHSGKTRTIALYWLRTSYHAQRYMFQRYMLRSLLTQSFNIVNTPIILLFSKKWVPGFAAEDNMIFVYCDKIIYLGNHLYTTTTINIIIFHILLTFCAMSVISGACLICDVHWRNMLELLLEGLGLALAQVVTDRQLPFVKASHVSLEFQHLAMLDLLGLFVLSPINNRKNN